jgi:hypothetical protein
LVKVAAEAGFEQANAQQLQLGIKRGRPRLFSDRAASAKFDRVILLSSSVVFRARRGYRNFDASRGWVLTIDKRCQIDRAELAGLVAMMPLMSTKR